MPKATRIESAVQLLVEGNDQRNFFEAFIKHLLLENIQVQDFGGVNDLRGFLLAFVKAPNFYETVQRLGIVRDAETSATGAFESVRSSLQNANLPVPDSPEKRAGGNPTVAALILPGENRPGMLETVLCESFAATPVNACIHDFFRCVEQLPGVSLGNKPDKARARVYLTTRPEPHLSVGVAAKRGYWDLRHGVFRRIRDFLQMMCVQAK